jgi:TRAP-type C4-dicarboxylate transport system permease small subunit
MRGGLDQSVVWLNKLAAIWAFMLAFLILYDVISRLLGYPVQGTAEIASNSIVAVVFMQFPLAIRDRTLMRATIVYDWLPPGGRRAVDAFGYFVGALVFAAMGAGGWPDMIVGWQVGEFEGDGAFRVPVYPIRTIVIALSLLSALVFAVLFVRSLFDGHASTNNDRVTAKATE